jgi:outer membrane biosynthesis protein TonB
MNSIDQHATRMRRAIGIGLLLFLIAVPAQANRIVQVRVGNHPTFTRLVFEMDAFTGYQVERRAGTDGAEQLTVTLEASTLPREITSKSVGIESVQIAEGIDQAIAQIRLRKSGLQMKEMILSNPPRIVLDFVYAATAVAERTGDPDAKPTPVEPPVREESPVAVVRPAPKPAVAEVVEPKPAPKPAVAEVVEPKPAPKPAVAEVVEPKPAPKPAPSSSRSPRRSLPSPRSSSRSPRRNPRQNMPSPRSSRRSTRPYPPRSTPRLRQKRSR